MFYTIYKITNKINGKIYIGKHQTKDLGDDYMGSGKLIKAAIEKYGIQNFKKEILFQFDNEADMNGKEAELVTEDFVKEDTNYNLCPGGKGGWGYINSNEEIISNRDPLPGRFAADEVMLQKYGSKNPKFIGEKISISLKKKYLEDEEYRLKLIKSAKTGNLNSNTPEAKAKRKATNQKKEFQKGEKNSQWGTIWITNGVESKKIKLDDDIPNGWYRGRKKC